MENGLDALGPFSDGLLFREIARSTHVLRGRCWRRRPWLAGEVKELRHIRHRRIARRQRGQAPTRLNEAQISCVIHRRVRNEILFRKRGDHDIWYAAGGESEVSRRIDRQQVQGLDAVRARYGERRHVVECSSALIAGEEENGVTP